jgi:hypothetical protein
MKNITVSISDVAYLKARVWTAEHGSSLSSVVAYLLETLEKIECAKNYYPKRTKTTSAGAGKPLTTLDSHCSSPREPCPPPRHPPPPPSPAKKSTVKLWSPEPTQNQRPEAKTPHRHRNRETVEPLNIIKIRNLRAWLPARHRNRETVEHAPNHSFSST